MKRLSQDSDESQHSTYVNLKIFKNIFLGKYEILNKKEIDNELISINEEPKIICN